MSFLRGSANYVWCTTSVLGKGATGAVFQGVNKHNGETVAVKTFNQLSHMRPQEVQMREFEVLQKVKHENIVKLLAIEEEQEGRGKVIVMELCTGGSLFNLLDDPENNFGLDEDEWLLVLSHLSAGMNHLRDNNLVHRDLKPGNIMKFIKDDGTIVYKLTDFGAARELQDDQQFVSLYGTEEYLHPDMYERAVLRKPVGKTFGATVDLWSIGVTLYHVATGNLPFRPFGGRRNKETMYHITTKKASGVISGVQTSDSGPIQWSRELPNTCLLSKGIRKHVTPLLAGLLEVNPQKMWTFERFFSEVTRILGKKKVHIFYMNKLTELRIYLDRAERLEDLQLLLTEQTDVEPAAQILLHQDNFLSHYVDPDTPGTSFPTTSATEPFVLYSKDNHNISNEGAAAAEVPAFPALPNLVSVENDATLAKSACAVGYAHRRRVEAHARAAEVMERAVQMLAEVIAMQLEKLLEASDKCKALTKMASAQLDLFERSHRWQLRSSELMTCGGEEKEPSSILSDWRRQAETLVGEERVRFSTFQRQLSDLSPAIEQLHQRCVREHHLQRHWRDATREQAPSALAPCAARARTYVAKLKESWQHLLRDRASRTLTYNDEQFHILEKIKMQETVRVLVDLLNKECSPALASLTELLADWYKMAQTTFLQAEILHKDAAAYEDEMETLAAVGVKASQERYESLLDESLSSVAEAQKRQKEAEAEAAAAAEEVRKRQQVNGEKSTTNAVTPITNGEVKPKSSVNLSTSSESKAQIRRALRSILTTQDEVWGILNENSRLIEQFGHLAVASTAAPEGDVVLDQDILAEIDSTLGNYGV